MIEETKPGEYIPMQESKVEYPHLDDDAVVYSAFVRAQRKFKKALKKVENSHLKSRYADLSECIDAVIDGLHDEGFGLTQWAETKDNGVFVKTVIIHESGGLLVLGELHLPVADNRPTAFGSALTYARRYSLMASFGLAPVDDDGMAASVKTEFKMPEHELAEHIDNMSLATDEETLIRAYKEAYKAAAGDVVSQKQIIAVKDRIKKSFGRK
jgi:hypothetical protein